MASDDLDEIGELRRRLEEATHTLEAIQSGSVDAVVVNGPNGPQIYTLESPDHPFRTFVEGIQEGALTLGRDGTIYYANGFFSTLVGRPLSEIVGAPFSSFLAASHRGGCSSLVEQGLETTVKQTLRLEAAGGSIPVQVTLSPLSRGEIGQIDVRINHAERHIELSVADTGSGISSDQIETIFGLFQQAAQGQRKGGLGLGLSISRQLVEAHGGKIRVASPGPGQVPPLSSSCRA